jgi:hypothetical protein
MTYLNRDMDGGPFLVYFLPILGGQKAAVSDSVEGWLPGRGMVCSRQPRSFQGVHPHGRPDRWTEGRQGRMTGRAGSGAASFVIPTSEDWVKKEGEGSVVNIYMRIMHVIHPTS